MSSNNNENRKYDSTGESHMDVDQHECPPHGPECKICKKYAIHIRHPERHDDDTAQLERKILENAAQALQTEAALHRRIAELQVELNEKDKELWKMKEENLKKEMKEGKGTQPEQPNPTITTESPNPTLTDKIAYTIHSTTEHLTSTNPNPKLAFQLTRATTLTQKHVTTKTTIANSPTRRNPSPRPRATAFQRQPPTAPRIRPFGPQPALTPQPATPRPIEPVQPARPSLAATVMATWRNAPPPTLPQVTPTPAPPAPTNTTATTANTTVEVRLPQPDPNIERDESDYSSDSEDEKRKKKKFPKPPKVPKLPKHDVRDQRAFLGSRAPHWNDLPPVTNATHKMNMNFNEPEARKMLEKVHVAGRFDLADTIRRVIAEVQSRRRHGILVNSGPAYLEREWRVPDWYHDARRMRRIYDSTERPSNEPFTDLNLELSHRGQPLHQSPREDHARWAAVYGTPLTYPGVPISSTLQLDLLGIQAVIYFRQLVPTNRSYSGPKGRDERGVPPGTRARTRWIALFIELLTQPFLYEQLLSYYRFQVNPRTTLSQFTGSLNMDMRELVSGLVRRGFTVQHANWMYEWAMNYLRDAEYIHTDTSNHGDFPRGLLLSQAADRLREVGAPMISNLPFERLWTPPASWNVNLYYQERNRRLALSGQQRRSGSTETPIPPSEDTARAHTSPAEARERDGTATSNSDVAGSSSGAVTLPGPPTIPSANEPQTMPDQDVNMEDVSSTSPNHPTPSNPSTDVQATVHPNAVIPYPPNTPSMAPNPSNNDNTDSTDSPSIGDAMDQD
ncbi:hypothetical protein V5O48_017981 [Marasmius crinis-equi]|uniref:Uncharacterized protein n=1 Tax=Marasmius crinis-equi TaxID=585013 RepID=A0ABR3EML3_9AGAR